MTTNVAIGLGSNLGDRAANLSAGIERLNSVLRGLRLSSIYETAPVGLVRDQPPFLNQVAVGETELSPQALLELCLAIETERGRVRTVRQGARTLDLDILLYGDRVIAEADLIVPHPRMHERGFVLVPLAEIAPDWVLPGGETVRELAEKIGKAGGKRWQSFDTKPPMRAER